MQIIIGIAIFIIALTLILYKVNNKFEKKEFTILLIIIILSSIAYGIYEKNQEEFFPKMFKEKYSKEKNVEIQGLTAELMNNKVVSSKTRFVYKFTYLVSKDNKEFLCTANNVEINKIEDNYIFKNFSDLKEECVEK
uniref:hypothetical protein n=1 Tax=Aliarcobacter sp. TaxID=2321116 RepID=UPI0040482443